MWSYTRGPTRNVSLHASEPILSGSELAAFRLSLRPGLDDKAGFDCSGTGGLGALLPQAPHAHHHAREQAHDSDAEEHRCFRLIVRGVLPQF